MLIYASNKKVILNYNYETLSYFHKSAAFDHKINVSLFKDQREVVVVVMVKL